MIVMTRHDDHRIVGQLTGLTNSSPQDDLNNTNEDILRRAKQIPPSLTKETKPFNAANYTWSGYRASCMNHWSTLKPHYKASNVTKMDIKATITAPMARSCKNIYKDPHDINTR